jgi:hypothetical protein
MRRQLFKHYYFKNSFNIFMRRFFLYLFVLLPFLSNAQNNFKPGYVITNSGDSIPGFINYKEREQNPSSISFRPKTNSPAHTYEISDVKAYGLFGLETYQRFIVDISQSKEALADISVGRDSTLTRDTVFLKVLQAGNKITLYTYADNIKTRYYIKEKESSEPYELVYATYRIDETGKLKDYNKYIRQLTLLLLKNNLYTAVNQTKLQSITYSKEGIVDIVSSINAKKAEKGMKSTRLFVGAAFNTSKASYTGKSVFTGPGVTNKRSYAPMITAGIDLFANPHIRRVVYRAELSFTSAKSDIYAPNTDPTIDYKEHAFDSYGLILTPQVIWNVFNTKPIKVFVEVGAALNFSKYNNNVTTIKWRNTTELLIQKEKVELSSFYYAPQAGGGIVINKRIEFFGNYMFKAQMSNFVNYGLVMERLNVGLKYLFN